MKPRLVAYSRALHEGGMLVRPARVASVKHLLVVGYSQAASMFIPPFRALCQDHMCTLTVYIESDWAEKLGVLTARHAPDATIVVSPEGTCIDLTVWRNDSRVRRVIPVCPPSNTPAGLAAAAALAWWHAETTV